MPQPGLIIRALIASPADVYEERRIIPEVIMAWNATHSIELATIIEPVKWESHSIPLQGDRPQALINKQLGFYCDFLIGVFWTKLGTNTGAAVSGTVEEIQEFSTQGKPVLLYFSKQPVVIDSVDPIQYANLQAFKKQSRPNGLQHDYEDIRDFRESLARHLHGVITEIINEYEKIPQAFNRTSEGVERQRHLSELAGFIQRTKVAWASERDTKPLKLDDAKYLLSRLAEKLLDFAIFFNYESDQAAQSQLQDLVTAIKQLQMHQVFMDGNQSYNKFWQLGDKLVGQNLDDLNKILTGR